MRFATRPLGSFPESEGSRLFGRRTVVTAEGLKVSGTCGAG
jgi:hypothetical protein